MKYLIPPCVGLVAVFLVYVAATTVWPMRPEKLPQGGTLIMPDGTIYWIPSHIDGVKLTRTKHGWEVMLFHPEDEEK